MLERLDAFPGVVYMRALPTPEGPQRFREEFRIYRGDGWGKNVPAGFRHPLWIAYDNPLEHLLVSEREDN